MTRIVGILCFITFINFSWGQCPTITVEDVDICGSSKTTINALSAPGDCNLKWYDYEFGGVSIASGCSFTTPILSCDKSYYLEDASTVVNTNKTIGYSVATPPLSGNGRKVNFGYEHLTTYFDTDYPITINNLTIKYSKQSWSCGNGALKIQLRTEEGTVTNYNLPDFCGSGTVTESFSVNFTVPKGTGHRLSILGQQQLVFFYDTGADYEQLNYNEGINITGTNGVGDAYGAFFDWDVTIQSYCPRIPVTVRQTCNVTEVCDNGIDDDCDGLIDCFDDECNSSSLNCEGFYFGQEVPKCQITPTVDPNFGLEEVWRTTDKIDTRCTPVIGDVDGDGIPEVIAHNTNTNKFLYVFSGRDGATEVVMTPTINFYSQSAGIADTDGDGLGEIFIVDDNRRLLCYENDGMPKTGFSSPLVGTGTNAVEKTFSPAFADFDGDGNSEIYLGNQIFDANTGAILAQTASPYTDSKGATSTGSPSYNTSSHAFPAAWDILPEDFCSDCSGLELVCGNVVYSVNLISGSLSAVSTLSDVDKFRDGKVSLADWDGDGKMDVIVSSTCCGSGGAIYIWDPRKQELITTDAVGNPLLSNPVNAQSSVTNGQVGNVSVADFDGDGVLEMAYAGYNEYIVLESDLSLKWSRSMVDQSRFTASVGFDFEGDGNTEIVYRDENKLYVLDGSTGVVKAETSCGSATRTEQPLVADVDGDGDAEIICTCSDTEGGGQGEVRVFHSNTNEWVTTRKVWHQHNYTPVYIDEDLSVPKTFQNKALLANQDLFFGQSPVVGSDGDPIFTGLPDAIPTIDSIVFDDCTDPTGTMYVSICNDGLNSLIYDFSMSLYDGDPKSGGILLKTIDVATSGFSSYSSKCLQVPIAITNDSYDIYVYVNDDGSDPLNAPFTTLQECDFTNNSVSSTVDCNSSCTPPSSKPVIAGMDITRCGTISETISSSSESGYYFSWYLDNVQISTPTIDNNSFNASSFGNYKVRVTDAPGNIGNSLCYLESDVLSISEDCSSRLDTLYVCEGASINLIVDEKPLAVWSGTEAFTAVNATTIQVSPVGMVATYYYGVIGSDSYGANLVVNGDFESGSTGFTSDYTKVFWMSAPDQYHIGNTANNGFGAGCVDHTSGGGYMYIADGSTTANTKAWCQNITVEKHKDYQIEMWAANAGNPTSNPSQLRITLNGTSPFTTVTVPTTACEWISQSEVWNAGTNTTLEYCIYDNNTVFSGNNFMLDDISVKQIISTDTDIDTFTVIVNPLPIIDLGIATTICDDRSTPLTLDAGNEGATFVWSPNGESSRTIICNEEDAYSVEVTSEKGCVFSKEIEITEIDCSCPFDNDSDGICDDLDLDDDNDGILDLNEGFCNQVLPVTIDAAKGTWQLVGALQGGSSYQIETTNGSNYFTATNGPEVGQTVSSVVYNSVTGASISLKRHRYSSGNSNFGTTPGYDSSPSAWTGLSGIGEEEAPILGFMAYVDVNSNGVFDSGMDEFFKDVTSLTINPISSGNLYITFYDNGGYDDNSGTIDFEFGCSSIDTDNDGTYDYLDLDSDDDGCFDALEGAGGVLKSEVDINGKILGSIDANGVPILVGGSGQIVVSSIDALVLGTECICTPPVYNVLTSDTSFCSGETGNVRIRFNGLAPYSFYYHSSVNGSQYVSDINTNNYRLPVSLTEEIRIDSVFDLECVNTISSSLSVSLIDIPLISGEDTTRCGEGELTLTAKTDLGTINWFATATSDTSLQSGEKLVLANITDTKRYYAESSYKGCKSSRISMMAIMYEQPELKITDPDTICAPNKVDLTVFEITEGSSLEGGTLSYFMDSDASVIYNTPSEADSSTYFIVVETLQGCSDTAQVNAHVSPQPNLVITQPLPVCAPEKIDLASNEVLAGSNFAGGDLQFYDNVSANNFYQTPNFADSGSYYLVISNHSCSDTAQVNVLVNPQPKLNLGEDTTFCFGDTLILDAANTGFNYDWNTEANSRTIEVIQSGLYSVKVYADGCEIVSEINVSVQSSPVVNLGDDQVVCEGEMVTLDAGNSSLTHLWSTGAITPKLEVEKSDTLFVIVTDNQGCRSTDTAIVLVHPLPSVNLGGDTTICFGDTLTLDAANIGFNYDWNTGAISRIIEVTEPGIYSVRVYSDGCETSSEINVSVQSNPEVDLGDDVEICEGESIDLAVTDSGLDVLWSTGSTAQMITLNQNGEYIVEVTNFEGCVGSDTILFTVHPLTEIALEAPENVCFSDGLIPVLMTPEGGYLKGIGVVEDKFDPSDSGVVIGETIWLTYSYSENKCLAEDSTSITVWLEPFQTAIEGEKTVCETDSLLLTIQSNGTEVTWFKDEIELFAKNANSIVLPGVAATGNYFVLLSNEYCSTETEAFTVNTLWLPELSAGNDQVVAEGELVTLQATSSVDLISWSNPDLLDNNEDLNTTFTATKDVILEITAGPVNCSISDRVVIEVVPPLTVPSAFTPNGDGVNDTWHITGLERYPSAVLKIFNRWGNIISAKFGTITDWDGKFEGKPVPVGTYYYVLVLNENEEVIANSVSVLR